MEAASRLGGFNGCCVAGVRAVARDSGAAAEPVGIEIDGDDDTRAKCPGSRDSHRVDQRPVDQPAAADADRRKYARQGVGGAQRQRKRAARQPDFVAGADLGGDGRKLHRQVLDHRFAEGFTEQAGEPSAADQARAAQPHIEIADDAAPSQRVGPFFQLVELVVGVAAANQGSHRRADDDVGDNALRKERPDHADMGKAARRAAAEHESDGRPAVSWLGRRGGDVIRSQVILGPWAPKQRIQHVQQCGSSLPRS